MRRQAGISHDMPLVFVNILVAKNEDACCHMFIHQVLSLHLMFFLASLLVKS